MEQLAVITGTFNPLTKAHISMGLLAQKKLGEDSCIVYVPSRHDFLTGWKEMPDKDILSDKPEFPFWKLSSHITASLWKPVKPTAQSRAIPMTPCATCVKSTALPVKTAFMYAALTNCPSSTAGNTQRLSCPDFHSLCSAGTKMIYRLCLLHHLWYRTTLPILSLWAPSPTWRKSVPPAYGPLFPTLPVTTGIPTPKVFCNCRTDLCPPECCSDICPSA